MLSSLAQYVSSVSDHGLGHEFGLKPLTLMVYLVVYRFIYDYWAVSTAGVSRKKKEITILGTIIRILVWCWELIRICLDEEFCGAVAV